MAYAALIRRGSRGGGDAIDVVLPKGEGCDLPPSERVLDAAIECTFPASDPIAIEHAFKAACAREHELEMKVSARRHE